MWLTSLMRRRQRERQSRLQAEAPTASLIGGCEGRVHIWPTGLHAGARCQCGALGYDAKLNLIMGAKQQAEKPEESKR